MSNWIPVSDRLPTREDADADYLVCIRYQDGRTALRSIYMAPNDSAEYGKPVAWLPIPPYEPPPPPKREYREGGQSRPVREWENLFGSAPNATGSLSSEAFVRKQRDDDWP